MAEPSWPENVDLAAYVPDTQTAQVKLRVPVPVVVLAADLLRLVPRRVAVRNASELVAALLVNAGREGNVLGQLVGDYRETQVHVVLATDKTEGLFELPPRPELEIS